MGVELGLIWICISAQSARKQLTKYLLTAVFALQGAKLFTAFL